MSRNHGHCSLKTIINSINLIIFNVVWSSTLQGAVQLLILQQETVHVSLNLHSNRTCLVCQFFSVDSQYISPAFLKRQDKSEILEFVALSNWRAESITLLSRILGHFFILLKTAWIFACDLPFIHRTLPRWFFHWFSLNFQEKRGQKVKSASFVKQQRLHARALKKQRMLPTKFTQSNIWTSPI